MTATTNLGATVSEAVAALMTPEYVEKQVQARVERLVVDAIDSALRSYSDTGKLIEKAVQEALKINALDLPSYGSTVTKILKAQIESRVHELVAGRLSKDMEELLSLAPKEVKLSKIAEEMLEQHDDDAWGDLITVIVETSDYGSIWVYLDEHDHHEDRDKYKARVRFMLSKDGTIFCASFDGTDMKDTRSVGRGYGLEQKIRAYHACGTKIILDEDAVVIGKGDY